MKKHLFSAAVCLMATFCYAQEAENLNVSTDRPTVCAAAYVMEKGHIQMESGLEMDFGGSKSIILPTVMGRWGITDFAEVRLQYAGTLNECDEKWEYSVQPVTIGTKVKIFDGKGFIPQTSLMANLNIPTQKGMHLAPQVYLLFNNQLGKRWSLCYNLGEEWNGADNIPTTLFAVCASYSISDNVSVFAESFNRFTKVDEGSGTAPCFDAGFTWAPTRRLQLDIYGGTNFKSTKNSFFGLGLGWLIH